MTEPETSEVIERWSGVDDGANRLLLLADLAAGLGAEPVAQEAQELSARVSEGRFYVA